MDLQQATREELIEEVKRLKQEVHRKNETLHEKNLELDALHYVWCNGYCCAGVHRYTDEIFDEAVVLQAEYQALRLRSKYDTMSRVIERWPVLGDTQTEWHRKYVERLKRKIGYYKRNSS